MWNSSKSLRNVGGRRHNVPRQTSLRNSRGVSRFGSTRRCRTMPRKKTLKTSAMTPTATAPTLLPLPRHRGERWRKLPGPPPRVGIKKNLAESFLYSSESVEASVSSSEGSRRATVKSSGQLEDHPSSDSTRCPCQASTRPAASPAAAAASQPLLAQPACFLTKGPGAASQRCLSRQCWRVQRASPCQARNQSSRHGVPDKRNLPCTSRMFVAVSVQGSG